MGIARNLARLVPNGSGLLPNANIEAVAASKLTGQVPDANAPSGSVIQVLHSKSGKDTNISVVNAAGGQNALYNSGIPSRVYADLTSITVTPVFATSTFLFIASTGMTSGVATNNGAFGIMLVVNNSTGVGFGGDFQYYPTSTSLGNTYGPDQNMSVSYSHESTSAFTIYFKGWAYSEGSSQTATYRNANLTVMEISA
jgi:hypothetical protein